ncbi:hypothetical protein K437DRAFT_253501 [Tilletiaria anomala UBC 951]|uniref:Endoplasmic reticulum protein n=1 Tax=Tilletiaria anomala (strain ATCC 24038 / CBS 436.72 / UBC 951) TaxID=1037660 RepID=A0A066WKR7_TILAU|nr:uncharacterized protein K437DRAFT_253501 [Tilletiaria anomala UBC 951]KDN53173.1 hypothetical protein K437DRAFT_253501 [Tilletiaria anomala UBC 951]
MSRPVASTPHLVWAGGHAVLLLAGIRCLLSLLAFWSSSRRLNAYYYIAYIGAIVSYGIVVYKSFGVPQLTKAYFQRAAMDENVQYFLLSLYWFWHKPIIVTLVPFVVFSLFHVLTFVRTTIIPMAFPSTPSSSSSSGRADGTAAQTPPPMPKKVGQVIQTWVKGNYDPAMRFVAYSEVFIFLRLLGGAMILRNSLISPLLYAHFLRLRFYMSSFTRQAFTHVGDLLDQATKDNRCPPAVRRGYLTARDLVSRYASSVLSVSNQGSAAGAPAGAAGGAAPASGTSGAAAGGAGAGR